MEILKTDGTKEPFSPAKFCLSLRKSGAPRDVADSVCRSVQNKITPNDSTNTIFRKALKYLVKENMEVAARYSLSRGLAALGPAGFIFEQYFETVLQSYGFKTKRDVILAGKCVPHEIDVIASVGTKRFLVEAKYHNDMGIKTHVDVIMYADARLLDVVRNESENNQKKYEYAMWVVTNTKFTDAAIRYAKCRGIRLTGWNYPRGASLEDIIADKKLYPVTVLPSIPKSLLPTLASRNIILAQDLLTYEANDLVRNFGISKVLAEQIAKEVSGLLGNI
ncbi:MAG: restriction endonuclease [Candidatus Pacebacteria bacterium]|nr:restriction endonuclease [Candidatus Paceibacterota bacterium]